MNSDRGRQRCPSLVRALILAAVPLATVDLLGNVAPAATPPAVCMDEGDKTFPIVAHGERAVSLLHDIVRRGGAKLHVISGVSFTVSVSHCARSVEDAVSVITRSCGLGYRLVGDTYYVGLDSDLVAELATRDDTTPIDTHYRCRHLDANTLVSLLSRLFPEVKIAVGPQFTSPAIQAVRGDVGANLTVESLGTAFKTHDVIISGAARDVKRAILLARQLDRQRKQVRVTVRVTEISTMALRELGVTWGWSGLSADEEASGSSSVKDRHAEDTIRLGRFLRSPVWIEAQLHAMEQKNQATLLTNAHMVLLDGERSFVLSGTRHLYPELKSITTSGVPTYDVKELKVGIYVQVGVQVGLDGDVVMSLYPQVSSVTGYLSVGDARYPVIATREQQTTVSMRSGETLAIGGLKREDAVREVQQVPVLGWLPLVGELFKLRHRTNDKSELVVLITPELID